VGIGVNLAGGAILFRSRGGSLNVDAAFRHVLADLLGSIGVVVAAAMILATGWLEADPVVSILIAVLVLASSWSILRDSTSILLEAAPKGIDTRVVGERLARAPGVVEVHDLHIWTITSGFPALSAHVLVGRGEDCHGRRRELEQLLRREFGIEHTTLQVDHASDQDGLVEITRYGERS
jgi:cobalt-zinc-cadmium efflux system protein